MMRAQFVSFLRLTSGTTWHSAAMINVLRGDAHEAELALHTRRLINSLEEETGTSPGYIKHGGLSVTKSEKTMDEFRYY